MSVLILVCGNKRNRMELIAMFCLFLLTSTIIIVYYDGLLFLFLVSGREKLAISYRTIFYSMPNYSKDYTDFII